MQEQLTQALGGLELIESVRSDEVAGQGILLSDTCLNFCYCCLNSVITRIRLNSLESCYLFFFFSNHNIIDAYI